MLKNASSLAIVGLDTAENGPSKVRQVTNRIDAIIGQHRRDGEHVRREGRGRPHSYADKLEPDASEMVHLQTSWS